MIITTEDVARATKSNDIKNIFEVLYNAVCEGYRFSDEEKNMFNESVEKYKNIPIQSLKQYVDKFADLDILKVHFDVLDNIEFGRFIQMSLV